MKTYDFDRLIFVWLLPLAAGVNYSMPHDGSGSQSQMTPHMPVALTPTAATNPLEKKNPLSLPAAQPVTTHQSARASTPQTTTIDKPSSSLRPDTASTATLPGHEPSTAPPMPSSSTSTQHAAISSTFEFSTSDITSSLTPSSEILTSPLTTSVTTESSNTTSVRAAAGTEMLMFRSTRQATKKTKKQEEKESNSGKVVAGLIGGALALMMVGFLVIYIKKWKNQKQQVMVTDWAGPSPFLQDEGDDGPVTLRSSNRISITNFLPHRLSKRLSLLYNMDQELQDMSPTVTFGHEGQGKDAKENNGLSASDTKTQSENGELSESPSSPPESSTKP